MNPDVYSEPYDYSVLPFALGDTMTWCVRSAIRARQAGRRAVEILVCIDPLDPHSCFQDRPNAHQYRLVFSEVLPAFYTHPLFHSLTIFHDRSEFNRVLEERARTGSLPAAFLEKYRLAYAQRKDLTASIRYLHETLSEHKAINEYFAQTGDIPWLSEVAGCQADVENLIRAQGPKARIVTVQFRLRHLDKAIVATDFMRDADYFTWENFLLESLERHPHVRFVILGRLQEKPLSLLQLPNVIAPRLLGLNLGHELSLLMRSHLFLGSSSGFAQCAHFCHTPNRIFNISESASGVYYDIPHGTDRLPFARPNQRLAYGKETTKILLANLAEALAEEETAQSSGASPRIARPGLVPADPDDATTFRFIPDVRQARHETSLLVLSSLARIKHNLTHDHPKEAIQELDQLSSSLTNSVEKFSPASPPPAARPSVRQLASFWWSRAAGKRFEPALPSDEALLQLKTLLRRNCFQPKKWLNTSGGAFPLPRFSSSWRFRDDQKPAHLLSESFRSRLPGMVKLIFQARRPRLAPERSGIHLWENGVRRTIAAPLYLPGWTTFAFEFPVLHHAELQLQFDNDFPGKWLWLRHVIVDNAVQCKA